MKVEYLSQFDKDIDKVKEREVKIALLNIINEFKNASSLADIRQVKKLKGGKTFYRVRIGDYRLGFSLNGQTVLFMRFLSRKDIYKYFP